jgi:hypothetical protein
MANPTRLQMIQAIITRLAGNSGALKGFAVTVVTALLGVSINTHKASYAWLGIYPIVVLGLLDAYYLALERRYRDLYSKAVDEVDTAWGLAAGKATLSDVVKAVGSPSVWAFYGSALVAVAVVALTI